MAVTSLLSITQNTVVAVITKGIRELGPATDDFFTKVHTQWQGVTSEGIGQNYQVIHNFGEGVSGSFKWQAMDTEKLATNQPVHTHMPGNLEEFPGPDESVMPGTFQRKIVLSEGLGNMFIPNTILRADRLRAATATQIPRIVKGVAQNIVLAEMSSWYGMKSQRRGITTIGGNAAPSGASVVIYPKGGQVGQLNIGQHVDIYSSSDSFATLANTTKINGGYQVVIDGIRRVPDTTVDSGGYGAVTLTVKGESTWAGSIGALAHGIAIGSDDVLVLAGSWDASGNTAGQSFGPIGPESWLANSGDIFDEGGVTGIDLAVYEQLQSVVRAFGGDPLDELWLHRLWGRYFKAYGLMDCPDTIVTSGGATTAYFENRTLSAPGFRVTRAQGSKLTLGEGFEVGQTPFVFHGKAIDWIESANMPSLSDVTSTSVGGRLWALKTKGQNLKRYIPPPIGGKRDPSIGAEIEFEFPLGGPMGIMKPRQASSGNTTRWHEAPFSCAKALAPDHIPGILLTGLKEVL